MRFESHPPIRTLADIEAIEAVPLERAIDFWTTYDLIAQSARDFADKPAFHFLRNGTADEAPLTLTYEALGWRMLQAANAFHRLGIGRGDVIAYLLPNLPETIYVLLGGTVAGAVAPINWMLEPEHIVHILAATRAKLLVVDEGTEFRAKLDAVLPRLANPPRVVRVSEFAAALDGAPADVLAFSYVPSPDDVALYLHTGGTTGKPKLAKLLHRGIAYHCWANAVAKALTHEDVLFAGGPLFHTGGIMLDVFGAFGIGATSVILSPIGFRNPAVMANYWTIARRYGLTVLNGVPTVLATLVNRAGSEDRPQLRPTMGSGSAPLPVEVAKAVERTFGVRPLSTYGATEFTCLISCPPRDGPPPVGFASQNGSALKGFGPQGGDPKYGSCGLPYAHSRFRAVVLDGEGRWLRDCAIDEIGAIVVKGPGVIPGYVDEADNARLFVDGQWLVTGDLGRIDADGYLWITGRAKDVIIRGGHNIDARVIEETLVAHPAVALAAAVGKPDAYAGELPMAYVQLKPGATATPDEIKAFARAHVPERAAAPVDIVIMDALPLTSVGKIYKPPLKQDAAKRAFEAALGSCDVTVSVRDDTRTGTCAVITLHGSTRESDVREIIGRYAVAYEIVSP